VVDDHLMRVSHVIRGEEWLSSTPKHALLYEAFGWTPPVFAHLPLLLSDRGGKLSKRHEDASVESFIAAGFLPEALVNFVAFLGWTPPSQREVMEMGDLIEEFSLERVHKGGAAVSRRKLEWLNTEHTARLLKTAEGRELLASRFMPFLSELSTDKEYALRVLQTIHTRLSVFGEIASKCRYWFKDPDWNGNEALSFRYKVWSDQSKEWLAITHAALTAHKDPWTPVNVVTTLKATPIPFGKLQPLLRYALTGTEIGASLNETICTLGRDVVLRRLDSHINH
jgi:glutamyl/glutaminyl-tRNA synthetase